MNAAIPRGSSICSPRIAIGVLLTAAGLLCSCRTDAPPPPVVESAPPPQQEVIAKDRIDEATFTLSWQPLGAGETQAETDGLRTGHLVLEPKAPFKSNLEYPYKLKVEAGTARVTKSELIKADMQVSESRVVVPLAYSPASDADAVLTALFAFSVCTEETCLIERKKMHLTASR